VQTILNVHKKYNALVMSAFNNDAGFVAALDKVCDLQYCAKVLGMLVFSTKIMVLRQLFIYLAVVCQ